MTLNDQTTSGSYIACKCFRCGSPARFPRMLAEYFGLSTEEVKGAVLCPECQKADDEKRQEETRKAVRMDSVKILLSDFPIAEENRDNTFDSYVAGSEQSKRVLDASKAFVEDSTSVIVLLGRNGNGKSHLAVSWLKESIAHKSTLTPCYTTELKLTLEIMETINQRTSISEVVDKYVDYDLLVIDELGKVKESEFSQQYFQQIIGERLDRHRKTFLIGNLDYKTFYERVTGANLSRMKSNGHLYVMTDEDYRQRR